MSAKITGISVLANAFGLGIELEGTPATVLCKFDLIDINGEAHPASSDDIQVEQNRVDFALLKAADRFSPKEDTTYQFRVWPVLLDGQELDEAKSTFHIHEGTVVSGPAPKREDPTPVDQPPPGPPQPPPGAVPTVPPPDPANQQPPEADSPTPTSTPPSPEKPKVVVSGLAPLADGRFGFTWRSTSPDNRFFKVAVIQDPLAERPEVMHSEIFEGTSFGMPTDKFSAGIVYGFMVTPVAFNEVPNGDPVESIFHVLDGNIVLGLPKAHQPPPPAPPAPRPTAEKPEQQKPRKESADMENSKGQPETSDLKKVLEGLEGFGTTLGDKIDTFGNQIAGGMSTLQQGQKDMADTLKSAADAFKAIKLNDPVHGKAKPEKGSAKDVSPTIGYIILGLVALAVLVCTMAPWHYMSNLLSGFMPVMAGQHGAVFQTGTNLSAYPPGMFQPQINSGSNCSNNITVTYINGASLAAVRLPGTEVEYYPAFTPPPKVVTNTQYIVAPPAPTPQITIINTNVIIVQAPPPMPVQPPPPPPAPQASAGPTADWQSTPPPQGPQLAYDPPPQPWYPGPYGYYDPCWPFYYGYGYGTVRSHGINLFFYNNRRTEMEWHGPLYGYRQGQRGYSGPGGNGRQGPQAGHSGGRGH